MSFAYLIGQKSGVMAHHCKPSDPWGATKAAQPDVASDKKGKAPLSTYPDPRSEGVSSCASDDTTYQEPTDTWSLTWSHLDEDFRSIKIGT